MRNVSNMFWLMGGLLALVSCGGDDGNAPQGGDDDGSQGGDGDALDAGDGTVTEPWTDYCTGIFTEDTPILDAFGDSSFTARAGEEYLLSTFDDFFGGRAEFLYLTGAGPDSFAVDASADGAWPFMSDCAIGEGVPYYAVFDDVSVFADEDLNTKICDLTAGTVLPAGTSGRGYVYVSSEGTSTIYEVILGPFSAECGGQERGYIRVPQTTAFGSTTWLVPIVGLVGPD